MRLNLGCGEFPIDGWTNVDLYPPADVIGDMRELEFWGVEEVLMSHSLEHLSWASIEPLLKRIHGWMSEGGKLHIEVPDMAEIMRQGASNYLWVVYIYGAQSSEGEFHRVGFTEDTLRHILGATGWQEIETRCFLSEHHYRPEMPCLEAIARA